MRLRYTPQSLIPLKPVVGDTVRDIQGTLYTVETVGVRRASLIRQPDSVRCEGKFVDLTVVPTEQPAVPRELTLDEEFGL